jgi:hypothetical protein
MDLIDKLREIAGRVERQRDACLTEQAAKTAFVLPFIQALGYDIFNPQEVVPELTADHGVKKGEKVDYAIKLDGSIIILIECKGIGANLEAKHAGQLFRYFAVTDARFGVLTDGIRYVFFSDLEHPNKMDDRPFFEFDLLQFGEQEVDELKKFSKTSFDLAEILGRANSLKYHKALIREIQAEFASPSDDLVKLLTTKVYDGRLTQQVKDDFSKLVTGALRDFIREQINARLKSALDTDRIGLPRSSVAATQPTQEDPGDAIETTPEELDAYRIIQAIGAELVDPDRIVMRDAKSYCAILLDDNNRRPVCRLYFGKKRMSIGVFDKDGEKRLELEKVTHIYQHRAALLEAIRSYGENT